MAHQTNNRTARVRDMFDLSLAHIVTTERERDLAADLRGRRTLTATTEETALEPASARRPVPLRASSTRVRAVGR